MMVIVSSRATSMNKLLMSNDYIFHFFWYHFLRKINKNVNGNNTSKTPRTFEKIGR